MASASIFLDEELIRIPENVKDLSSFREWYYSDEFPENGRICFIKGEVWVDMSTQQFFTHNQIRGEIYLVLFGLVKKERLGKFAPEGILLSNLEADISVKPDGAFFLRKTRQSGKVRLVEGKSEGFVELEGTPDMVLEIVSNSSLQKDKVTLKAAYEEAGIAEYWLVDARGEKLLFEIFRLSSKGYVSVKKQGGWLKSIVFGKEFRLIVGEDEGGDPEYTLEMR